MTFRTQLILLPFLLFHLGLRAQVGSDILEAHLKAIGGNERWSKIRSLALEATLENEFEVLSLKKWWVRGKSYRQDIRIGGRTVADSTQTYFVIVNGEKGWKKLPDQKNSAPITLDSNERQWYLNDMELLDPLLNDGRRGKRINYLQTEYFNDKFHHKFQIQYEGSPKLEYAYLDPDDLMLVMTVSVEQESENTRSYSSFKQHPDGYRYPSEISTARGILRVNKIDFNPVLKPDQFNLPTPPKGQVR